MEAYIDRRLWEQLEFSFLLLAQLVGLVWLVASLLPLSASAQTRIAVDQPQSAAANLADPAPPKLGAFMDNIPSPKRSRNY
jgi:hypothetical protein